MTRGDRSGESCRLNVKVIPGARRDAIVGWLGDALKIKVSAPPSDGRATERVLDVLAASLAVPRAQVRLVTGATSRQKIVEISGLDGVALRRRLPANA